MLRKKKMVSLLLDNGVDENAKNNVRRRSMLIRATQFTTVTFAGLQSGNTAFDVAETGDSANCCRHTRPAPLLRRLLPPRPPPPAAPPRAASFAVSPALEAWFEGLSLSEYCGRVVSDHRLRFVSDCADC